MKTVQSMLREAEAEVPHIRPEEAKGLFGRTDVLFLDAREPNEVAASGKVAGTLTIPRGFIEFRADATSAMHDAKLNRAKTVVVYCGSGGRAALAAKTLKEMGFSDVRNHGWLQRMVRRRWQDRKRVKLSNGPRCALSSGARDSRLSTLVRINRAPQ